MLLSFSRCPSVVDTSSLPELPSFGKRSATFFIAFGLDLDHFRYSEERIRYDLGISGFHRNPTFPGTKNSIREEVQSEVF